MKIFDNDVDYVVMDVIDNVLQILREQMLLQGIREEDLADCLQVDKRTVVSFMEKKNVTSFIYLLMSMQYLGIGLYEMMFKIMCKHELGRTAEYEQRRRILEYQKELQKVNKFTRNSNIKNKPQFDRFMKEFIRMFDGVICFDEYASALNWPIVTDEDVRNLREILQNCLTSSKL